MGLRAPAKGRKYHTGLCPWQPPNQVTIAALAALYPSSPLFARCGEAYPWRTIPAQIPDYLGTRIPDAKTTRMEKHHDTQELCQICVSCRYLRRHHAGGNIEQFPAHEGY